LRPIFVIEPHSFYIENRADLDNLLLFIVLGCFSVIIITQLHDAIERERAELQESDDHLRLCLKAAHIGSYHFDPTRHIFSWDTRSKEILDTQENESTAEQLMALVHPDDVERAWAAYNASLDPYFLYMGMPPTSSLELRIRRADGELRWVRFWGHGDLEGAGRERRVVRARGTVEDITEQIEWMEREHLLTRESAHRTKNLISVVDVIAHQTAAKHPEDFVERFSDRMKALSANQDLLARSEGEGVEIGSLVHAQLGHFADAIGSRISADGPRLRVNSNAGQAIGLALHELATNAAKYGALSTEMGRVDIRWGVDGETFTMSWAERGGPPVSAPQRRGFGSTVVTSLVKHTLNGEVQLDYAPSGLAWRLTCPHRECVEPLGERVASRTLDVVPR
jgi:two-component sensor histidine kinase